uniref:RCD-1-2 n=1 Tax=Neurospora crassa TaxID=5141 RepID=UPI00315B3FF8
SGRPMDNEEWFPLKQTHYPPPTIPSMKTGHPTGPISIGHIIPDLRHLDNVINCKGFEPFPPNMDVFTAHYEQCHFGDHLNSEFVVQAGLHHTNITSDRWEYDSVVEYAVYPTRQYIDRLLESKEVRQYIQASAALLGGWCVYMVTGIMVARGGGRNVTSEEKGAGVSGPEVGWDTKTKTKVNAHHTTDFVCAIRLVKIAKSGLRSSWTMKKVTREF